MTDDELIRIWKSSPELEQIKFEHSILMLKMQSQLNQFNISIKYRDAREIGSAILIIPIFAYYIFTVPFMVSKIASGLFVALRQIQWVLNFRPPK